MTRDLLMVWRDEIVAELANTAGRLTEVRAAAIDAAQRERESREKWDDLQATFSVLDDTRGKVLELANALRQRISDHKPVPLTPSAAGLQEEARGLEWVIQDLQHALQQLDVLLTPAPVPEHEDEPSSSPAATAAAFEHQIVFPERALG